MLRLFKIHGSTPFFHRWYQPQLGRFLQVDPKGFDASDENLFRYCDDDPVDKTDPEGLMPLQSYSGQISAADRMDLINLAGETSLQGNAAASALSAYNNSSGAGSQRSYAVAWTQKMARAAGLVPITQDRKLQGRNPRELAIEAAMQAKIDSKGDTIYSYNVYQKDGKITYQRSDPAQFNGSSYKEKISPPPNGVVFIANGHVHPAIEQDNPHRWTSHSPEDQRLSNGRLEPFIGTGPVTFINKGGYSFHEYNQGVVSTLTVEGYGP